MNIELNNEQDRLIYTVSKISNEIKLILEDSYPAVWVRGEVSNFRLYSSGHMYFNIKDSDSQIKAIMFRNTNVGLNFKPTDGNEVLIFGRISTYLKSGDYQIIVSHMEQFGQGALYNAYEKLKNKLEEAGLFEQKYKKKIPDIVNKIAIVTSKEGAALYDILKVIDTLNIDVEILICPTRVQGKGADKEIVKAIEYLNIHHRNLDVLLLGRGGGQIEDLWAFNSEDVAKAIFNSKIPIVSCVGHEIDFTIADFVSDLRAPTPSAAAEIVLRKRIELQRQLTSLKANLYNAINNTLVYCNQSLQRLKNSKALTNPQDLYKEKIDYINELSNKLLKNIERIANYKTEKFENIKHKLQILSPYNVFKRGFSICFDENNKIIKESKDIEMGKQIKVQLAVGNLYAEVKKYD
ncbi:MAG: exodeoxyribonuclease VII large subunit [Endomicrobium sp.]|jgi:exodeoxyribonuclease VII large subunit|uniref:exodeoxyribonuclease VII large subunit n=1 Tax=Candidatus Endomicrobiellum cubanum TaxID=3242325 RepID=UPI002828A667|nr:exodeoxyribonuclease VII large subunit [Endomicrobium sp.]